MLRSIRYTFVVASNCISQLAQEVSGDYMGRIHDDERWILTPKGCFSIALKNHLAIQDDLIDIIWEEFEEIMVSFGYVHEEEVNEAWQNE